MYKCIKCIEKCIEKYIEKCIEKCIDIYFKKQQVVRKLLARTRQTRLDRLTYTMKSLLKYCTMDTTYQAVNPR